jgi:2-keto-4-pentenoate hydratase
MMDSAEMTAAKLARSFLSGTHLSGELEMPTDLQAAYRIQEAAAVLTGFCPCGAKIGATNAASQAFLGASGPIFGPVFRERVWGSELTLSVNSTILGAECEFGFVIAKDFPQVTGALERSAFVDLISDCFPAIEIAARRIPLSLSLTAPSVVADLCFASAVIRGPSISNWRELDLTSIYVTALVDGCAAAEGSGADVLGDPLRALAWLAGERATAGLPLRAGEIIVTGSCTGITRLEPGVRFDARFGGLTQIGFDVKPARAG